MIKSQTMLRGRFTAPIYSNIYRVHYLITGKSKMDNLSQPLMRGCNEQAIVQPYGLKQCSELRSNSKTYIKYKMLTMLTKQEKNSIIYSVCIGDGHLRLPSSFGKTARTPGYVPKKYQLTICHDIKQINFLKWKRDLLEECLGKKINIRISERLNNDKKGKRKICTLTVSDAKFNKVYKCLYKNKEKVLPNRLLNRIDSRGLAILFGDDGWGGKIISKRNGKTYYNQQYKRIHIATQCFSDISIDNFLQYLFRKWNIKAYAYNSPQGNGKRVIIQKQQEVDKFLVVVSDFLEDIKGINYKLCK